MTFRPGAELDPGQVSDLRGRRMGGGGGLAVGGGGLGLVLVIAYLLLGGDPSALNSAPGAVEPNSSVLAECQSGVDANERDDCRIVGFVNSIQAYWEGAQGLGAAYRPARTALFSDAVQTGCGPASSEVGPFYCPPDESVYLDLGFFDAMRTRLGAKGGPLAEGYVVAHEYGHHIQNINGVLNPGGGGTGEESQSVRTELQADCLAGVWLHHAAATGFLEPPTDAQLAEALDAAAAVGDDRIQSRTEGQVNPEAWTHGSAAQRQQWLTTGYTSGSAGSCDTFKGDI